MTNQNDANLPMMKIIAIVFTSTIFFGHALLNTAHAAEQLKYTVVDTADNGIELREYAAFIVAEVEVEAESATAASSAGFRPLAGYIFGGNTPNKKIAMTAPVTTQEKTVQEKEGQKIAMTAPVTTTETGSNTYVVRFSMPAEWTMDTLPEPNSDKVTLVQMPKQYRLAKTYRGGTKTQIIAEGTQALLSHAKTHGLNIEGEVIWAGYSSPFVPKPLRKWEMLLQVSR